MNPKLVGNPLVAWRSDTVLQIGWGTHGVSVEGAPPRVAEWLRLINGTRSRAGLLESAAGLGVDPAGADQLLDRMLEVGLIHEPRAPLRVAIHAGGLVGEHLGDALREAGVELDAGADIVIYPQGQLPCLVAAPRVAHRLIPVWFETSAVHVGPVLDVARGPCPECIDRTWAQVDGDWTALVAQATSVATWHEPAQLMLAAGAIAHIADSPHTVGLETIFDRSCPGPMWRVWTVNPGCTCQLPQVREQPHFQGGGGLTRTMTTAGPGSPRARR
ncbi:MAG: hypothetical protein R2720_06760 [Candidatus Nanopelagicales bacterium]